MKFFMVIPYYLNWHYTRGLMQWSHNLFSFLSFEFHFFSVKDLLLTLFAPFQRLKERHTGSPIDFEAIASVWAVNLVMRLIGFVIRSFLLVFAAIAITISFVLVLSLLVLWIVLPLLLALFLLGSLVAYFVYKP